MVEPYQVIVSPLAEKDLEQILEYILEQADYKTAVRIQRAFLDAICGLGNMPTAHGLVRKLNPLWNKYRRVVVKKSWRVIFEINEELKSVYVIRILHVKRSPDFIKKALE